MEDVCVTQLALPIAVTTPLTDLHSSIIVVTTLERAFNVDTFLSNEGRSCSLHCNWWLFDTGLPINHPAGTTDTSVDSAAAQHFCATEPTVKMFPPDEATTMIFRVDGAYAVMSFVMRST